VSVDTSHQNEQKNSQLPHESSSTENYLHPEGAEQRQQVTLISKIIIQKYVIFDSYNQVSYLFMHRSIYLLKLKKKA
jgi:hypothetical protein